MLSTKWGVKPIVEMNQDERGNGLPGKKSIKAMETQFAQGWPRYPDNSCGGSYENNDFE